MMSSIGNTPREDPSVQFNFIPKTGSKRKGVVNVTLSGTDQKITLAARNLKKRSAGKTAKMHGKYVHLTVNIGEEKTARVAIKVKNLANELRITKDSTKRLIKNQQSLEAPFKAQIEHKIESEPKPNPPDSTVKSSEELILDLSGLDIDESLLPKDTSVQEKPSQEPKMFFPSFGDFDPEETLTPSYERPTLDNLSDLPKTYDLPSFGIQYPEDFDDILKYYSDNKADLEKLTEPTHIRRSEENMLERSLVYVPSGPAKGLYVLCKDKGRIGEVGLGAFNRATLALHVESGEKKIFRTALAKDVPKGEIQANQKLVNDPEHFVGGVPVSYKGSWSSRNRKVGENKKRMEKLENQEKVGFIMDYAEGGELAGQIKNLSPKEQVGIALEYAKHIAQLKKLKLVHLDQKSENTFMKGGKPKLGDFGMTVKKGGRLKKCCGTLGMMAPEVWRLTASSSKKTYKADFPADVWSMGCVFSELIGEPGNNWRWGNGQVRAMLDNNLDKNDKKELANLTLNKHQLELKKDQYFPERKTPGTLDHVIDQCLQLNPKKRPTADKVVAMLEEIYNSFRDEEE